MKVHVPFRVRVCKGECLSGSEGWVKVHVPFRVRVC